MLDRRWEMVSDMLLRYLHLRVLTTGVFSNSASYLRFDYLTNHSLSQREKIDDPTDSNDPPCSLEPARL